MIFFLFKEFLSFYKKFIPSGISLTDQRLFVLDGHGNHVTLEIIEQGLEFDLKMISVPIHTSHVLQPLNVSCFKPFKTTLRKVKDTIMSKSNHMEPNKITMA
jgi:hypothetical protein